MTEVGFALSILFEPDAQAHEVIVPPAMLALKHVLAGDTSCEVGGLHRAIIATKYGCASLALQALHCKACVCKSVTPL